MIEDDYKEYGDYTSDEDESDSSEYVRLEIQSCFKLNWSSWLFKHI